jgi:hypothetical protein
MFPTNRVFNTGRRRLSIDETFVGNEPPEKAALRPWINRSLTQMQNAEERTLRIWFRCFHIDSVTEG